MKNFKRQLLVFVLVLCGVLSLSNIAHGEVGSIPSQINLGIINSTGENSSVSINWVTNPSVTNSQVVYGTDENLTDSKTSVGTIFEVRKDAIFPEGNRNSVEEVNSFTGKMENLTPGKTYFYKVGNENDGYSSVKSFVAPKGSSRENFSFLVSADTQGTSVSSFKFTNDLYDYLAENENGDF